MYLHIYKTINTHTHKYILYTYMSVCINIHIQETCDIHMNLRIQIQGWVIIGGGKSIGMARETVPYQLLMIYSI